MKYKRRSDEPPESCLRSEGLTAIPVGMSALFLNQMPKHPQNGWNWHVDWHDEHVTVGASWEVSKTRSFPTPKVLSHSLHLSGRKFALQITNRTRVKRSPEHHQLSLNKILLSNWLLRPSSTGAGMLRERKRESKQSQTFKKCATFR